MAHRTVHRLACLVLLLAVSSAKKEQTRWSRQISTYTSDISDWVPLTGPVEREPEIPEPQIKRQAIAEPRILTEPFPGLARPTGFSQDSFPSRAFINAPANRQLYLQSVPSVPSAPQNYLSDQGFGQGGIRFGLSQPNFPLTQGFVAPPFGFDNFAPPKARPQTIGSQIAFTQPALPVSTQAKPFNQAQPVRYDKPKFIDGYRAENISNDYSSFKRPQSLQKIKFESVENKPLKPETLPSSKNERGEEVQLLYVPLESLNKGKFNFRSPVKTPQLINTELYSQPGSRPNIAKQTFINEYQRPAAQPLDAFSGTNYFSEFKDVDQLSKYTTLASPFPTLPPTTPKPKKLKPHQPPLAIFMTKEVSKSSQVKVGDVLSSLKNADTIAVLDTVNPLNAPKVFIGPSTLPPPDNYVKFELPYLSNIENIDKKLKQLPFFVAPLSYNTPNGFAKIPFPSPHVGSVVINSQIREGSQQQGTIQPNLNQNSYIATPAQSAYKPEQKPATQKPTISYYSTVSPKTNQNNYQSNYYSIEPQTVSSIRPPKQPETVTTSPKQGSFFMTKTGPQYNSQEFVNYRPQNIFKSSEVYDQYDYQRQPEIKTTLRTTTTTTTTTKPPSTYPSQLLETHNPYSINQAFHFSTPLDYHSYFDDVKQPHPTPSPSPSPTPTRTVVEPKPEQFITEKPKYQASHHSTPNYLQNYTPEIHYDSDPNLKYPVFNPNDYISKTETTSQQIQPVHSSIPINHTSNEETSSQVNYNSNFNSPANNYNTDVSSPVNTYNTEHSKELETKSPVSQESSSYNNNIPEDSSPKYEDSYNSYVANYDSGEVSSTSSSTTTTTTTTRRTPLRVRGRPRYTTTPRSESHESTPRVVVTRRPLRERKPLPTRPRYEPNKITTEKPNKIASDSSESTTKSTRSRTRGRIQFKASDNDNGHYDRRKTHNNKEQDLAYQRDVLHQNYPVTLMERMSTVDIEAITEPSPKSSSPTAQDTISETVDTENAYTNERVAISHQANTGSKEETQVTYTVRSTQTEPPYVPNLPSTRSDFYYQSRSSKSPVEAYDESLDEKDEDSYAKQTTPVPKSDSAEVYTHITETEPSTGAEETPLQQFNNEFATNQQDDATETAETENLKIDNEEESEEEEENVVQTTPSYNRVRVRPGVIRQYQQSTTERSKERKKPNQPVTYRPAFDRRRTTMRIDEIEADLKTKQVHARPEQEYRHPVYKPDPTTEPTITSSTTESTKRGHFRRRRPTYSYTSTSTEAASTRRIYDVKNRFRGRRPTDKPTESTSVQTESPVSTTKNPVHSRYNPRLRLSERYNKKPEVEETTAEDQDSNYSINRPSFAEPEGGQWSPKISTDSFKPYNPNDIVNDQKIATTERRSDKEPDLDIITARNEYDEILLTVTPASNNRMNKKIPDIPPTLEALVEQSKVTKSDSGDNMSTFESMLEEVMKSLEEQDQDEYSAHVMKHKGGEIGEIPPERVITSGDNYVQKSTTATEEVTTEPTTADDSTLLNEEETDRKSHRRGFWKKVKVRPVTTESIEFAESQYYTNTVNRLGQQVKPSKLNHDKTEVVKTKVTTYKPPYQFIKDLFTDDDDEIDVLPTIDIPKIGTQEQEKGETLIPEESKQTTVYLENETQTETTFSPGDLDLGIGSPDPTIGDSYFTTPTEASTTTKADKSEGLSFMEYLFGVTSEDSESQTSTEIKNTTSTTVIEVKMTTEQPTESAFIPEEITTVPSDDTTEVIPNFTEIKKVIDENQKETDKEDTTEISIVKVESASVSSFVDPANFVSTSMSTEISHETEICFRGKCIKTNKDIL